MKPQLMRWRPTTCECEVIEYKDENGVIDFVTEDEAKTIHERIFRDYPKNTVDPAQRPQRPIKVCKDHEHLGVTKELYKAMNDEAKLLGDTMRLIRDAPENQIVLSDQDKYMMRLFNRMSSIESRIQSIPDFIFDPGKSFSLKFDKNRVLIVTTTGFSDLEKQKIKSTQESKFGQGKVEIL